MDIQTRKITFIKKFLDLDDEKLIFLFEKLLEKEGERKLSKKFCRMTLEEFNARIDKSLSDFAEGRVTESDKLIAEIESW